MKNRLFAAVAVSALMLSAPVLADDSVSTKTEATYTPADHGGYESKDVVQHTDAGGTVTTRKTDEKVDIDSKGNKATTVKINTKTDPKGIFNSSTSTEIVNKATEKNGKTEYSHKKTVNGDVVEQSDDKKAPPASQ